MVTETKTEIRIYVASLADYNGGILHGAWINANQDPESIKAEVAAMLAESHEPGAEEWAIHDYEGFKGLRLGEWESFEKVAELAEAIDEHGEAFALYAANVGTEYAEVDGFLDVLPRPI
jgi:antirestriction protein